MALINKNEKFENKQFLYIFQRPGIRQALQKKSTLTSMKQVPAGVFSLRVAL